MAPALSTASPLRGGPAREHKQAPEALSTCLRFSDSGPNLTTGYFPEAWNKQAKCKHAQGDQGQLAALTPHKFLDDEVFLNRNIRVMAMCGEHPFRAVYWSG